MSIAQAVKLKELEQRIAALEAQLKQFLEDKPKRGRPPKEPTDDGQRKTDRSD